MRARGAGRGVRGRSRAASGVCGGGSLRLGNGSGSPGRVGFLGPGGTFGDLVGGRRGGGWGVAAGERLPTGCRRRKEVFLSRARHPWGRREPEIPCRSVCSPHPGKGRAKMLRVRCFPENLSGLRRGRRAPRSPLRRETRFIAVIFVSQKM